MPDDEWNSSRLGETQTCSQMRSLESDVPAWSVTGVLIGISHDWKHAPDRVVTTLTFKVGDSVVQVVAP